MVRNEAGDEAGDDDWRRAAEARQKKKLRTEAKAVAQAIRALLPRRRGQVARLAARLALKAHHIDVGSDVEDDGPLVDPELEDDDPAAAGYNTNDHKKRTEDHYMRVVVAETGYRLALPDHIAAALAALPLLGHLWQQQARAWLSSLQQAINSWALAPVHHACAGSTPLAAQRAPQAMTVPAAARLAVSCVPQPAKLVGPPLRIAYHSTHATGYLDVPRCECEACGLQFPMPAAAVGCVEASHDSPTVWVDARTLVFFHAQHNHGESFDDLCSALEQHATMLAPASLVNGQPDADLGLWPPGGSAEAVSSGACDSGIPGMCSSDAPSPLDPRHLSLAYRYSRGIYDPLDHPEARTPRRHGQNRRQHPGFSQALP